MTVRDALASYFERRGIKPHDESIDQWLSEKWVHMTILGRRVPVKPIYGYKPVLIIHDVHHLLAGYETTWTGEFEVAAWELGSGGCEGYLLMWGNRFLTTFLGLVFARQATRAAYRRGTRERNLYAFDCRSILACDVDALRAYVENGARPAGLTDRRAA